MEQPTMFDLVINRKTAKGDRGDASDLDPVARR